MSSRNLIQTALDGKQPERIPVSVISTAWTYNHYGMNLDEVDYDSDAMAEAWLRFDNDFDADAVCPMFSPLIIPEYYGTELRIPEGGFPIVKKPAITDASDIDELGEFDSSEEPRAQAALDCVEKLVDELGSQKCIWLATIGPVSNVSRLMETQTLMMQLIEEPESVHEIFNWSTEVWKSAIEPFLDLVDIVDFSDPVASPDMISPKMYEDFFWQYDKDVVDWLHDSETNAVYHVCGDVLRIIDRMELTGADGLSVDAPLDLEKAREAVPDATIVGNIDPANQLLEGTPESVVQASKQAMYAGGRNGPMILAPGCDVPPTSPPENVRAMIRAAKEYGVYPLNS
jgi:uroporphyrinogen decarboxylase